jgi:hypothetical protein
MINIKPNFNSDEEKEKHAIYVINLMLSEKLFPKYDDFSIFENIGKLPNEERSKAIDVQDMIKKILKEHTFAIKGHFEDDLKMTDAGRKLTLLGSYENYFGDQSKKQIDQNEFNSLRLENERLTNMQLILNQQNAAIDEKYKQSQIKLTELQTKEIKTKRKWAVLGALGGSVITFIITYAKEIKRIVLQLFQ